MSLEEKRKLYVCGNSYVCLNDIPLWPVLYRKVKAPIPPAPKRSYSGIATSGRGFANQPSNKVRAAKARQRKSCDDGHIEYGHREEANAPSYPLTERLGRDDMINDEINNKISLWQGDITRLEIDCIIHAAKQNLRPDRGSESASLYKIAGPTLLKECMSLNGCEMGDAKITAGHKLPAKFIIHTAGPIGKTQQSHLLQSCYERCLQVALENNIKSLAFCCISTGLSGYPNREAAEIALKTVRKWLLKNSDKIDRIIFCTFLSRDFQIYQRLMTNKYFPCESKERPLDSGNNNNNIDNNSNNSNQAFEDNSKENLNDDPMTLKRSDSGIVGVGGSERSERIKGRSKDDNDINVKKKKSCKLRRLASARRSTVSSENKKIDFRELQARLGRDTPPERPHSRTSSFERPSLEKRPSFRRAPPKIIRRVELNESSDDEGIIEDVKAGSTDTSDYSKPPSEVDSVEADTSECDVYVDESCDSQSIASSTTEDNMRFNAGDHEPDNHHLHTYNQNNSDAHSNRNSNLHSNHHNNTHHYNSVTRKDDLNKTINYQHNYINNDTSNNNDTHTHTINNDHKKDELNNTLHNRDNQDGGVNNNQNDGDKTIENKNNLVVNVVTNNKQRVDDIKEVNVQSKTRYASNHILNDYARERIEIDIDIVGIPTTYSRERLDSDTEVNHMNLADELNDILSNNEMEEYPDSLTSSTTSLEDSTLRSRTENDVLSKYTAKTNGLVEKDIYAIGDKTKMAALDKYDNPTTNGYGHEDVNGFNGYGEKHVYNVTKENHKDDILNGIETSDYKDDDIYSIKELNADSGIEEQLVSNGFEKEGRYMNGHSKDKPYDIEGNFKSKSYSEFRSEYTNGHDSISSSTDNGFSGSDDSVNSDSDSKLAYMVTNGHGEEESKTKSSENDLDMYLSSVKNGEDKEDEKDKYGFESEATNDYENQDIHTIPEMDEFLDENRSSLSNGFGHDTSGGFIDDDVFSIAMGSAAQTVEPLTEKIEDEVAIKLDTYVSSKTEDMSYSTTEIKEELSIYLDLEKEENKYQEIEEKTEVQVSDGHYEEDSKEADDVSSDYKFETADKVEAEKIEEERILYAVDDVEVSDSIFVSSEEKEELIENNKEQSETTKSEEGDSGTFEASNFSDYLSGGGTTVEDDEVEEEEEILSDDDDSDKENVYSSSTESIDKNIYPILETNEVIENEEEEEEKVDTNVLDDIEVNGLDQTKDTEEVTSNIVETNVHHDETTTNGHTDDTVLINGHKEESDLLSGHTEEADLTNGHIEEESSLSNGLEKEQTLTNRHKEESTILNGYKEEEIISNGHEEESVLTNWHKEESAFTNGHKEEVLSNGHKEDSTLTNDHKEKSSLTNGHGEELTNGNREEKTESEKSNGYSSIKSYTNGLSDCKDKDGSSYSSTKSSSLMNLSSEPAPNGTTEPTKASEKYNYLSSKSSSLSTSDLTSSRYSSSLSSTGSSNGYSSYSNGSSSYSDYKDKYNFSSSKPSSAYSSYSSGYSSSKYDTNTKSYSDYKDRYSSDSTSSLTSKYGTGSSYGSSYSDYKSKSSYSSLSDSTSSLSSLRSGYGSSYDSYSSRSTSDYGSYASKYSSSYNKYSSSSRIADVLNKYDSSSSKRY